MCGGSDVVAAGLAVRHEVLVDRPAPSAAERVHHPVVAGAVATSLYAIGADLVLLPLLVHADRHDGRVLKAALSAGAKGHVSPLLDERGVVLTDSISPAQ